MLPIVDFPSEVLSQIFGSKDSSYLVIKIWLCGSTTLNKKLSNGLTYLNLALHQFATCRFPRLVSEFYNLRHFVISSEIGIMYRQSDWAIVMKSLPKTLVSLSIRSPDSQYCLSDFDSIDKENLPALDLASLLPCLQTLNIRGSIPSDRFAFLPQTLTELTADIKLIYNSPNKSICRPLSQLPRGLLRLNGYLSWQLAGWQGRSSIDLLRADLLNVPPHLQCLSVIALPAIVLTDDFRFPESLTKLTMPRDPAFHWTPSIALIVPSKLHTLEISVDMRSLATLDTNWVSDLPRSLINLIVNSELFAIDFTSFSHCLPPNLEQLSFLTECGRDVHAPIGDWSCINTSEVKNGNHWPKSLTFLELDRCLSSSFDFAKLPRTLLNLSVSISKYSIHNAESIWIDSQNLPPLLTELTLACKRPSKIQLCNLECLTMLKECRLRGNIVQSEYRENFSFLSVSPEPSTGSILSMASLYTSQHLTILCVPTWHCDWFAVLPRGLQDFVVNNILGLVESSSLATHDVFIELPTSLLSLSLRTTDNEDSKTSPKIPPQRLDHLSSLHTLVITAATVPSRMIRMLPASLSMLQLCIEEWNGRDHLYLPPRIELLMISKWKNAPIAEILQSLPLVALHGLGRLFYLYPDPLPEAEQEPIRQRIAHEVKHP